MTRRTTAWLAWSLVVLSVAFVAGGVALAQTMRSPALELPYGSAGDADYVILTSTTVLTFSVVGAIVASRPPPQHDRLDLLHYGAGDRPRSPREGLR